MMGKILSNLVTAMVALSIQLQPGALAQQLHRRSPPIEKEIVQAKDYLGLVKKGAMSSLKPSVDPCQYSSDYLREKPLKWLERAEGSIYRDYSIMTKVQDYYALKMARSSTQEAYLRARQKGVYWTELLEAEKDSQLEMLIEGVPDRYMQDAHRYQEELFQAQLQHAANNVQVDLDAKMREAYRAVYLCTHGDPSETSRMARLELGKFAQMTFRQVLGDDIDTELDQLDMASKAIFWARKLRLLRSKKGIKRSRE